MPISEFWNCDGLSVQPGPLSDRPPTQIVLALSTTGVGHQYAGRRREDRILPVVKSG